MKISREILTKELIEEGRALFTDAYSETIDDGNIVEPDYEIWSELEKAGLLIVYVARDKDNNVIGYAVFTIGMSMFNKGLQYSEQIALFVDKKNRAKVAVGFMRKTEVELSKIGIEYIIRNSSSKKDIGKLYERLGYNLIGQQYGKRL